MQIMFRKFNIKRDKIVGFEADSNLILLYPVAEACRRHPWNFWKTLELHKTRCIHMYNTDYSLQDMLSSALLLVDTDSVVCIMYLSSLAHVCLCWFWQEHCYGQKVKVMYWQELVATLSNIRCKSVRGGGRTEQGGRECSGWASRGASFVPINIWGAAS